MKSKKDTYCYECMNDPCSGKHRQAHTPTPWVVRGPNDNGHHVMFGKGPGDMLIGEAYGSLSQKRAEANAAFIVRAVNSHEDLLKMLKCWIVRYGNTTENKWLAENSRAAISKAEEGL